MKKTVMLILSVFITLSVVAYDGSAGINPMELHQAYMSGKEKITQHRNLMYQQDMTHVCDFIKSALIGAGVLYGYKLNINYDPESWTSSPWIARGCYVAIAILMLKEMYGILFQVRPALAELATMEASIDAEYKKQLRYLTLGETEEEPVVESEQSEIQDSVSEESAAQE